MQIMVQIMVQILFFIAVDGCKTLEMTGLCCPDSDTPGREHQRRIYSGIAAVPRPALHQLLAPQQLLAPPGAAAPQLLAPPGASGATSSPWVPTMRRSSRSNLAAPRISSHAPLRPRAAPQQRRRQCRYAVSVATPLVDGGKP